MYHGEKGLKKIATEINKNTKHLKDSLEKLGYRIINSDSYFDTITIEHKNAFNIYSKLKDSNYIGFWNKNQPDYLTLALDEVTTQSDLHEILQIMQEITPIRLGESNSHMPVKIINCMQRHTSYLDDPVFKIY